MANQAREMAGLDRRRSLALVVAQWPRAFYRGVLDNRIIQARKIALQIYLGLGGKTSEPAKQADGDIAARVRTPLL